MSWQDVALSYIEAYYDTSSLTSTQWSRRLNIAAKESVDANLEYANGYSVAVSGLVENWSVSPDPSTDGDFIQFVALKSLSNISVGTINSQCLDDYIIQDGTSKISLGGNRTKYPAVGTFQDLFLNLYEARYGGRYYITHNFGTDRIRFGDGPWGYSNGISRE